MDETIRYLNTDLDLTSAVDLSALATACAAAGVHALEVRRCDDGLWSATFETVREHTEPESNIAAFVEVIESLEGPYRSAWNACTLREFNIGYDCGTQPWAFNQGLSPSLLGRMAAIGASLRITLYPTGAQLTRLPEPRSRKP